MALAQGKRLIPEQPGKKRQKGVRKPLVAFRCPADLMDFIDRAQTDSVDRTDVILKLLRVAKDAGDAMGDEWWELEKRANVEHIAPGTILGRLALEALTGKKKR